VAEEGVETTLWALSVAEQEGRASGSTVYKDLQRMEAMEEEISARAEVGTGTERVAEVGAVPQEGRTRI
jgi:hypothetical protein